jgi:2-polyprenyl-6-methoxyphenol hydroxylase-like FAD-dependent oxidoreductase
MIDNTTPSMPLTQEHLAKSNKQTAETSCCVVGGGPGGMMLALLLARQGVSVTLMEAHKDFDREFRGDTVHPSILEVLDQIGLAEPLHELRHAKLYSGPTLKTGISSFSPISFKRLKTRFPYVMLIPQTKFLDFLAAEARKFPNFRLVMGAMVEGLIEENGVVKGVRYMQDGEMHELRAHLTVGADGRFSKVRQLSGLELTKTSPPMDILWFRLPHSPGETSDGAIGGGFAKGKMLAIFDRQDYWQVGYVFQKGHYAELRAKGLDEIRDTIVAIAPQFAEHVKSLTDWHQFSLLSVESGRCEHWYKPGLLLIGDAAHVMSPIGGVGINYAVQDAVVAANLLAPPMRDGRLTTEDLGRVQKKREWSTKVVQFVQSVVQKRVIANVLQTKEPRVPPAMRFVFKIPFLRDIPGRIFAFGVQRVRFEPR